ncbi:MAG: lamin tail domain-containing protein, partial [Myxococcales bacterium]|nr:lamin tail domain-containing protein [Myxococcales bacterium]
TFPALRGVLHFAFEHYRLEPRSAEDVERGAPRIVAFGPAETALRVGREAPPSMGFNVLTVQLDQRAGPGGVTLGLSSSNPDALAVPAELVIAEGSLSNSVVATGLAEAQDVTITVTLADQELTALVDVLPMLLGPTMLSIEAPPLVELFGAFNMRITADRLPEGEPLALEITLTDEFGLLGDPMPFIFGPEPYVDVMFTAGDMAQVVGVTVTAPDYPGVMAETTIEVVEELPPAAIVINEIDYTQPDGDTAEYIELLNVSDGPVDLTDWALELVDGEGAGGVYATIPLVGAEALAAGAYLVVGSADAIAGVPEGVQVMEIADATLQNGGIAPDGVRLMNGTLRVDSMSYDGFLLSVTEETSPFQGDPGNGGLSRCPNGADTDNNGDDFTVAPGSPGLPNTCGG